MNHNQWTVSIWFIICHDLTDGVVISTKPLDFSVLQPVPTPWRFDTKVHYVEAKG